VPPAIALLNYMRNGTLSRIYFSQTGIFPYIINIAGRISEAAMGGGGAHSAPFYAVISLKRTSARSVRARRRGQNPRKYTIFLFFFPRLSDTQIARRGRNMSQLSLDLFMEVCLIPTHHPPLHPHPPPSNGHVIRFVTPSANFGISIVVGLKYSAYMCAF
jgi:hypothetical protein